MLVNGTVCSTLMGSVRFVWNPIERLLINVKNILECLQPFLSRSFFYHQANSLIITLHPVWLICFSHLHWRVKTSLLSLCCVFSDFLSCSAFFVPSIAFCRYLNPWFKRDYNVAKWVEDVNKNTEGPYFRYFIN